MIEQIWTATFQQLDKFTQELEKVKSHAALQQVKPIWRILKSVQLKYVPALTPEVQHRLDQIMTRLDIRDVEPSAFAVAEVSSLLERFSTSCTIDPDSFELTS